MPGPDRTVQIVDGTGAAAGLGGAVTFDANTGNDIVNSPEVFAVQHVYDSADSKIKAVRPIRNITAASAGGTIPPAGLVVQNGSTYDPVIGAASPYPAGTVSTVAAGYTKIVTVTLTRPANTDAYTSGDEVTDTGGTIRTFTSAARATGLSGVIVGAHLIFSTVWTTVPTGLELHIYDTTSTPTADNSAFAPSDGVAATELGYITFNSNAPGTVNATMDSGPVSIPFVTSGSANLFGRLVVRNAAQDSANSSTITIRLRVLQD